MQVQKRAPCTVPHPISTCRVAVCAAHAHAGAPRDASVAAPLDARHRHPVHRRPPLQRCVSEHAFKSTTIAHWPNLACHWRPSSHPQHRSYLRMGNRSLHKSNWHDNCAPRTPIAIGIPLDGCVALQRSLDAQPNPMCSHQSITLEKFS